MTVKIDALCRWLIRRDMDEVLMCEQSTSDPLTEEEVLLHLRQRDCIGAVIEDDDQNVVGYMVYRLAKSRYEIIRIAIRREFRMMGFGRRLMQRLIAKLSYHGERRRRISVLVSEYNLGLQLFLQKMGFRCIASCGSDYHFVRMKEHDIVLEKEE